MAEHKAIRPGEQVSCPANVASWTDDPVVAGSTQIKVKTHFDELRAAVNAEETRRGVTPTSWTNPSLSATAVVPRAVHTNELRAAIYTLRNPAGYPSHSCPANQDGAICGAHTIGDIMTNGSWTAYISFCQDYCRTNTHGYCASDSSVQLSWTDDPVVSGSTRPKAVHITEMRSGINAQKSQCVCELEACNYCADCGHSYLNRTSAGCACDDHKYSECMYSESWVHNCATVDEDTSDFRTALAANLYPGISNATMVPWNCMCGFAPPGDNWSSRKGHNTWGCKCSPYRWLGGS